MFNFMKRWYSKLDSSKDLQGTASSTPAVSFISERMPVDADSLAHGHQTVGKAFPVTESNGPVGFRFDPGLIPRFLDDHRRLLSLYSSIMIAAETAQWDDVEKLLKNFRIAFTDHILVETVKLYVYLKQSLRDDAEILDLMKSFAREMQEIGKITVNTVVKYENIENDPVLQSFFLKE